MGCLVTGTFSDGMFSDGMFSDGTFSDGTFSDGTFCMGTIGFARAFTGLSELIIRIWIGKIYWDPDPQHLNYRQQCHFLILDPSQEKWIEFCKNSQVKCLI